MAISFSLPQPLEANLRHQVENLDQAAKEAFLVALYRQGKLTHVALSDALGLDRFETEDVLQKHGVTEDLGTYDDYLADAKTLEALRHSGR